jgi:tripartite-type tricarboxylate transporter receptor subunit TctC
MQRRTILKTLPAAAFGGWTARALAQAKYPDKPIRIIVPWSAGGGADAAARAAAAALAARLAQPVVVDNKPGASGVIGAAAAAASNADGYTLFLGNVDTNVLNPQLLPQARYRPEDFEAIVEIGRLPMALVVRKGLRIGNAADLTRVARASPGKLTYGTWGIGSVAHLAFAMLQQKAGIELHHVPYQGGAPTYAAILGGHVDLALAQVSWANASAAEGKVHLLGVTSRRRSPLAPELPTLAELGFSGYAAEQWLGLFAPKGSPRVALDAINAHVNAWLATPQARAQLAGGGAEGTGGTPAQLGELQRADYITWGKVIQEGKIRIAELR